MFHVEQSHMGHARTLLAVENPEVQKQLAKKVVKEQMSVRELEAFVRNNARRRDRKQTKRQPKPVAP